MPKLTDEQYKQLVELRAQKKTRNEIAKILGVSFRSVLQGIAKLIAEEREDAVFNSRTSKKRELQKQGEGMTLMERCKGVLGKRMGEDHRGYLLDGRPASSAQVRRAAGL